MKTVHKLVLKAYIGPMMLTFFLVMFILMMNVIWRYIDDLVGKGLSAGVIIELLACATTNIIPLGLPLATLLAAIMAMGNLGENYELLAMKSAGMSLPQILKPLIWLMTGVSIGCFFIANNLVPYANNRMYNITSDIKKQKQLIEFQDGLFFNGIENMSIRVGHQDPETHLLRDLLIYDNQGRNNNMTTTVADSGYIRLSDDKKYLLVTLYNGERYEQTRNHQWFNANMLQRSLFSVQDGVIPMEGFSFERSNNDSGRASSKNLAQLDRDIDSLDRSASAATDRTYEPLLRNHIFSKNPSTVALSDSLRIDVSHFRTVALDDSIARLDLRSRGEIWTSARTGARSSRGMFSYDETSAKASIAQLYNNQIEWHRKFTLSVSVMIFFLIGAPLGAIIRKGGLGFPIVISVIFFVIYYMIMLGGEKMAREGTWPAVYGSWLSSFILAPVAAYLTYKATNDSSLLDTDWYAGRIKYYMERWNIRIPQPLRRAADRASAFAGRLRRSK